MNRTAVAHVSFYGMGRTNAGGGATAGPPGRPVSWRASVGLAVACLIVAAAIVLAVEPHDKAGPPPASAPQGAVGGSSQAGSCRWRPVVSPNINVGRDSNHIAGLDVLSEDLAWAVGWHHSGGDGKGGGPSYPLVLRWDGRAWRILPVPDTPNAALTAVVAVGRTDAWAVGSIDEGNEVPLALHWDGSNWTRARLPYAGHRFAHLDGVAASGEGDVWAVGDWATGHSGGTLAMHFDGSRWRIVRTPSPPPRPLLGRPYPGLQSVAMVGDTLWSVGSRANVAPDAGANTLALRYRAGAWTVVPTPNVPDRSGRPAAALAAVAVQSSGEAWAVGSSGFNAPWEGPERPLIVRWAGWAWTPVSLGAPAGQGALAGVAVSETNGAWAVGWTRKRGVVSPLIQRWNDTRWAVATVPPGPGDLRAVSVSPRGTVWAAGSAYPASSDAATRTLILTADCHPAR
jgi:hypothetical protein